MQQLLWCDPTTLLQKRRGKLQFHGLFTQLFFLFNEAIEEFFLKKNYRHFDPHVGDNFCQARACQLTELSWGSCSIAELRSYREHVKKARDSLEDLQMVMDEKKDYYEPVDILCTVSEFLSMRGLDALKISPEHAFIFRCYLLTKYRAFTPANTYIEYGKIQSDLGISSTLANSVVKQYQREICKVSCAYTETIFRDSKDLRFFLPLVERARHLDDVGREVLPYYLAVMAILERSSKLDIPQILRIQSSKDLSVIYLLYQKDQLQGPIDMKPELFAGRPVILWHGLSGELRVDNVGFYVRKLSKMGIKRMFLALASTHRQYSGKLAESVLPVDSNGIIERTYLERFEQSLEFSQKENLGRDKGFLHIWHIALFSSASLASKQKSTSRVSSTGRIEEATVGF